LGNGKTLIVVILGCGSPNLESALLKFKNQHSDYQVLNTVIGEGDSDNVYVNIQYKKQNNNQIYEEKFLVQKKLMVRTL
jgi:hypothetical protein